MERIDILTPNGRKTGNTMTIPEAHKSGQWHNAVHIWVYNSQGEILLQQRSAEMHAFPLYWDISASGHVSAGETISQAAVKELYEELGILTDVKKLTKVRVIQEQLHLPGTSHVSREFDHVFILQYDGDVTLLQKEEVNAVRWVSLQQFEAEVTHEEHIKKFVPHGQYYIDMIRIIETQLNF